jgi:hypothetical protein
MSNFKHGFYSTNVNVNPDCLLIKNIAIKQALLQFEPEMISVVKGEIVTPGVTDLVVYLIDCALPDRGDLLPQVYLNEINDYFRSKAFTVLSRINREKSLDELIKTVEYFK